MTGDINKYAVRGGDKVHTKSLESFGLMQRRFVASQ